MVDIKPGATMQADNFAIFVAHAALTTSFNAPRSAAMAEFTVRFRAREAGRLSQLLYLSGRITPAEAYPAADVTRPMDVKLRFGPTNAIPDRFELFPCTPNPFPEQTAIGFRLPVATTATLRIVDTAERTIYVHTADYAAGLHSLPIHKSDSEASGVFFYQLQTPTDNAVRKMMVK